MARHDRFRRRNQRRKLGSGARALLKDGLYEKFGKPNFALGFHDKADMETGHIGVTEGYTPTQMSIQST